MIGLVTYAKFPDLTDDDRPLIGELAAVGVEARPVRWDDAEVRWTDYDMLVLRSCWDYHVRAGEFRRWLSLLERMRVPLWNPVPLVRWNMHKGYLRDVAEAEGGVLVPRTRWVEQGERITLSTIFREERWTFPWAEDRPIFFFELVGDTVWGATGAMLRQLLGLVTGTVARGELDHI